MAFYRGNFTEKSPNFSVFLLRVGDNIVSGLNAWTVICLVFVHEEYLGAVDLTSHVGIIPTWLASYFLV